MPTATVTFPNLSDSPPDSSDVNQNFTDVLSHLNTHQIQSDASLAFTSLPSVDGAPTPTVDTQAVCKKFVDESSRQSEHRVRDWLYPDNAWIEGDPLSIQQWSDTFNIAVPSWATTAMITVNFSVTGYGGDSADPRAQWQMWGTWGAGPAYAFDGSFGDNAWGLTISRNQVTMRSLQTVPANVKGTTFGFELHVLEIAELGGNSLNSGSEHSFSYDFIFWS